MVNINIDPIWFRWGTVAIGWHGFWLTLGTFLAYLVFIREGQGKGIGFDHLYRLLLWMTVVGYVGARLVYVLQHWDMYAPQPVRVLMVHQGGMKIYGGLIGGTIVMAVYARRKGLSFWSLADAIAVAIPVGEIVARVGCTINGDNWGVPTGGSWGLVYLHPNASIPAYLLGVPTFPVQNMLQVWNAGLLALLFTLRRHSRPPGFLFVTCTIVYSVGRFIVSTWQPQRHLLFGLKETQVVSVGVIGLGILLLTYLNARFWRDKA